MSAADRELRRAQLADMARRAKALRQRGCGSPYGRPVLDIIERNLACAEARDRDPVQTTNPAPSHQDGPMSTFLTCAAIVALIYLFLLA